MKILVFGATGGTGRNVVSAALAAGHEVTAFARRPAAIDLSHERLRKAEGDVLKPETVSAAVAGQDAVISAIGPSKGAAPGTLISDGIRNILAGMDQHGVRRLVFESGLMVADLDQQAAFARLMLSFFRRLNHALAEDKVLAENRIRDSKLDWTIVRPPVLSHAPGKGSYRSGPRLQVSVLKAVSHADVADYMLKLAADKAASGQTVAISY